MVNLSPQACAKKMAGPRASAMVILLQEMLSTQSRETKDNNSKKEREEEREKGMSKPPPSLNRKTSIISSKARAQRSGSQWQLRLRWSCLRELLGIWLERR